ncbi:MAG: NAD(P)H-dependent oxidoreductase [Rhodobacteraceae bacterium]|nr:NAD(P)H-dependent oxidoreductase [Paracoccaceae bacterium]MCY4195974.1 NAD(P)H-dependent oxidoreductase [Paracoccaceae bacterium]
MTRAFVIYCHPDPESFTSAVLQTVIRELRAAAIETRIEDLYATGFAPVLHRQGVADYPYYPGNTEAVRRHVENIQWCDMLIFVYPTWWYSLPAMLKGWLDRTMVPGVAFHLPPSGGGSIQPGLSHITHLAVFTTCGASRIWTYIVGAPGKRILLRGLRAVCARRTRTAFAAHYKMDSSTPASRARHLKKVEHVLKTFLAGASPSKKEVGS